MKLKVLACSALLAFAPLAHAGEPSGPSVKRYGTWGVDLASA